MLKITFKFKDYSETIKDNFRIVEPHINELRLVGRSPHNFGDIRVLYFKCRKDLEHAKEVINNNDKIIVDYTSVFCTVSAE